MDSTWTNGTGINYTLENVVDYYPYGKVIREYKNGEEKYLTTYHQRDDETGLDYRGARYYDADVPRFFSMDPFAANQPAWSTYKSYYCNPIIFIDPDGRTEYKSVYLTDASTGKTLIHREAISTKIMTDGVTTRMAYGQDMTVKENNYYDYENITHITLNADGTKTTTYSTRIMKENGIQDSDYAFFGGDEKGDTKSVWSSPLQGGGLYLVSDDGGTSTDAKSLTDAQMMDISDLLAAFGAKGKGTSADGSGASDVIQNIADIVDVLLSERDRRAKEAAEVPNSDTNQRTFKDNRNIFHTINKDNPDDTVKTFTHPGRKSVLEPSRVQQASLVAIPNATTAQRV